MFGYGYLEENQEIEEEKLRMKKRNENRTSMSQQFFKKKLQQSKDMSVIKERLMN